MNILIIGGLGFIGSNLVDYWLLNNHESQVMIYDSVSYAANRFFLEEAEKIYKNRLSIIKADLLDKEALSQAVSKADIIYHLAAETHVGKSNYQSELFIKTNIIGFSNLLEAVKDIDSEKKIVFTSSAEIYGSLTDYEGCFNESSFMLPQSVYAMTKCAGEHLAYLMNYMYNLNIVIVRLFNNYGPRQHAEKVIPRFICRALNDLPLQIEGNGKATRDWIYVEETCRALYKLAFVNFDKLEIINISSKTEVSILDIAKLVLKYTGKSRDMITFVKEREGNVYRHLAANNKMEELLGIKIKISFEQRLAQLIEWYRDNLYQIKSSAYMD